MCICTRWQHSVITCTCTAPRTPDWSWTLGGRRNLQCTTPQHHNTTTPTTRPHSLHTQPTCANRYAASVGLGLGGQASYLQCKVRYTPPCPVGQHSQSDPQDTGLGRHSHRRNHWGTLPYPPGCLRLDQRCTRPGQLWRVRHYQTSSTRWRSHTGVA